MEKFEFVSQKQVLGFLGSYGVRASEITIDKEQQKMHVFEYQRILYFRKYAKQERDIAISDITQIAVKKKLKIGTVLTILAGLLGFFFFGTYSLVLCLLAFLGLQYKQIRISSKAGDVELNGTAAKAEIERLLGALQEVNPQIQVMQSK